MSLVDGDPARFEAVKKISVDEYLTLLELKFKKKPQNDGS